MSNDSLCHNVTMISQGYKSYLVALHIHIHATAVNFSRNSIVGHEFRYNTVYDQNTGDILVHDKNSPSCNI
jgi:hypothetical protein